MHIAGVQVISWSIMAECQQHRRWIPMRPVEATNSTKSAPLNATAPPADSESDDDDDDYIDAGPSFQQQHHPQSG